MSEAAAPKPRIREPNRDRPIPWLIQDDSLPPEHPARLFWEMFGALNLDAFATHSKSVEGHPGRTLRSPRMMLTLWSYALSQGITSARRIARLLHTDLAFRWIVRDIDLCHQKLSDFRVAHRQALNDLFTQVLAVLLSKKLVSLELVGQDGTRVRASAASSSFRGEEGLAACAEQAALHLRAVLAAEDQAQTPARHARQVAAARDYARRVADAQAQLAGLHTRRPREVDRRGRPRTAQDRRKKRGGQSKLARVSTTDPDARVMKMPDTGFRPGYNVMFATAGSPLGGPRTIVGVLLSNQGTDTGMLLPMTEEIEARTGQVPKVLLADGNHLKHSDIQQVRQKGVRVLVPPKKSQRSETRASPPPSDPAVAEWLSDTKSEEGKKLYKARASLSELANAMAKGKFGLDQVQVRGQERVVCVVLLTALASNLLQHSTKLVN